MRTLPLPETAASLENLGAAGTGHRTPDRTAAGSGGRDGPNGKRRKRAASQTSADRDAFTELRSAEQQYGSTGSCSERRQAANGASPLYLAAVRVSFRR